MSKHFEWQADDNLDWDALPDQDPPEKPTKKHRRWLILVAILLLAGIAAGLILRQVNRRVDENTQAMRADILSSYNLLQIADADKDEELFFSVLSGSSSSWTTAQKDLFDAGLLYNREPLGLSAAQTRTSVQETDDGSIAINFTSDFREAEVISEQPFTIEIGHGLTSTIVLQETAIYRLGRERWLLSPPSAEFWGENTLFEGSRLSVSSPERDADLTERLRADLDRKIDEMCRTLRDINCSTDLAVNLRFSSDPASLAAIAKPLTGSNENGTIQLVLPSPTLTGIPVDEQGYQALFRAYAGQVLSAVISNLVDFTCCRHAAFHQALLNYQLDQLSLKPWPVSSNDYQRILDERLQIGDIDTLWRSEDSTALTGSDGWQVYAFLDYLLSTYPELSPANLQRELVRHESFYNWIEDSFAASAYGPDIVSSTDLLGQFWLQAYKQTFTTEIEDPVLAPGQDLLLTCELNIDSSDSSLRSGMFSYNVKTGNWSEIYSTENVLFMNALPDDNRLILVEFNPVERGSQTKIWQDSQIHPLLPENSQYTISFGQTDPAGSGITTFVFPPGSEEAAITLFDTQQCDLNGCPSRVVPSIPVWSPDGSQALFTDEPNAQLALIQLSGTTILFDPSSEIFSSEIYYSDRQRLMADEEVTKVADLITEGSGYAPFWLDNETIGYIASGEGRFSGPGQEILTKPVAEGSPQVLVTLDDLVNAMPDPSPTDRFYWIKYAVPNPADSNLLYIAVFSTRSYESHILSYNRRNGQIDYLFENTFAADHTFSLSPDGRFQIMTGREVRRPGLDYFDTLLLLHDRENDSTTPFLIRPSEFAPFPMYDWSSAGDWLAMMLGPDIVGLFSPQNDILKFVDTPVSNCISPVWTNP